MRSSLRAVRADGHQGLARCRRIGAVTQAVGCRTANSQHLKCYKAVLGNTEFTYGEEPMYVGAGLRALCCSRFSDLVTPVADHLLFGRAHIPEETFRRDGWWFRITGWHQHISDLVSRWAFECWVIPAAWDHKARRDHKPSCAGKLRSQVPTHCCSVPFSCWHHRSREGQRGLPGPASEACRSSGALPPPGSP